MVCPQLSIHACALTTTQTKPHFVLGFAIDRKKIAQTMNVEYSTRSATIDEAVKDILDFILDDGSGFTHSLSIARSLPAENSPLLLVVSLGSETFDSDPLRLKNRDICFPTYLGELEKVFLTGPAVFELTDHEPCAYFFYCLKVEKLTTSHSCQTTGRLSDVRILVALVSVSG